MSSKQVFISHTQKDVEFCDKFDAVCVRVGIKVFRSEFETIVPPAWGAIKNGINNSVALFLLVGKELVKNQSEKNNEWNYTQNWISYEIGVACQLGIDVWAICDDVLINFPMPYINNYMTVSLGRPDAFTYMRRVLENYDSDRTFKYPYASPEEGNTGIYCGYDNCKMEFNLHVALSPEARIICPQCLRPLILSEGHLRLRKA
ncbi:MAG: hypothetical protein Q8O12_00770 [Candidatus Omnitrophota bacterium]|nr:hypothetical protein [Candidatus Omnitrophota bacterium]